MNDSRPGLGAVDTWKGWASAWRAFGFDNAPGGSPPTSGSRQDRLPQSETRNPEVHANWALRRILAQSRISAPLWGIRIAGAGLRGPEPEGVPFPV